VDSRPTAAPDKVPIPQNHDGFYTAAGSIALASAAFALIAARPGRGRPQHNGSVLSHTGANGQSETA